MPDEEVADTLFPHQWQAGETRQQLYPEDHPKQGVGKGLGQTPPAGPHTSLTRVVIKSGRKPREGDGGGVCERLAESVKKQVKPLIPSF